MRSKILSELGSRGLAEKMVDLFNREIYRFDIESVLKHGLPKFAIGDRVKYNSKYGEIVDTLWSDHFSVWTYRLTAVSGSIFVAETDIKPSLRKKK